VQQAQIPALSAQPAAQLQGININNATAQFQQENAMTTAIYSKLGGALAGKVNPTQEDVLNAVAATSRALPQIGVTRPDILTSAKDMLLKDPTKISDAAKTMVNMSISPETGSTLQPAPPNPETGATQKQTTYQSNVQQGPRTVSPPLGAEASAGQMYTDLATSGNYQNNVVPWMKAKEYLANLPLGSTGPGSETRNKLEEGLWALSPTVAQWAGVNPSKITNFSALGKYLAQAANNLGGAGTDMHLIQTITGTPNLHINDLTDRQLVDYGIAVQRMGSAQTLEASRGTLPNGQPGPVGSNPMGYSAKKGTLAPQLDPRAFEADLLNPDQLKQLNASITTKAERDKFNRSYQMGVDHQFFTGPGQY
jgi:hypothetical protein